MTLRLPPNDMQAKRLTQQLHFTFEGTTASVSTWKYISTYMTVAAEKLWVDEGKDWLQQLSLRPSRNFIQRIRSEINFQRLEASEELGDGVGKKFWACLVFHSLSHMSRSTCMPSWTSLTQNCWTTELRRGLQVCLMYHSTSYIVFTQTTLRLKWVAVFHRRNSLLQGGELCSLILIHAPIDFGVP
jgi:hypothetical protein